MFGVKITVFSAVAFLAARQCLHLHKTSHAYQYLKTGPTAQHHLKCKDMLSDNTFLCNLLLQSCYTVTYTESVPLSV